MKLNSIEGRQRIAFMETEMTLAANKIYQTYLLLLQMHAPSSKRSIHWDRDDISDEPNSSNLLAVVTDARAKLEKEHTHTKNTGQSAELAFMMDASAILYKVCVVSPGEIANAVPKVERGHEEVCVITTGENLNLVTKIVAPINCRLRKGKYVAILEQGV